jgi:hypothetical protein
VTNFRVKLVVEGMERDEGHVRLEVFVNELQKLQAALARADKTVSDGERCSYFAIVGLSHSSPATVELEARVLPNRQDWRQSTVNLLTSAIRAVERGEFTAESDPELLADIKELAAPVGASLRTAYLVVDGASHYLTAAIATNITTFLADQEQCLTTVEGMLERVNVHDGANEFTIFPHVGANRIRCKLPQELAEKGISAIRRRVAVSGLAKYRKFAAFPHEIDAEQLEIYGLERDLPTFDDLRGIAPDATGDLSSEDFVKELRHGWH